MTDEKEYEVDFTLQKRVRRKPEWMKDYIHFISRNNMVKTKNTPRKASYICGICQETFQSRNIFKYHVLTCTMKELGCDICKKKVNKRFFYEQYMMKKHQQEVKAVSERKSDELQHSPMQKKKTQHLIVKTMILS